MACLGWISCRQRLRFRLELLCQVATRHRSNIPIHFTDIFLRDLGHGPREGTDSPRCQVCLCKFCEQHRMVSQWDRLYRWAHQYQLLLRMPRLRDPSCRGSSTARENGPHRHYGYRCHRIRHFVVLLHQSVLQHE